MHWKFYFCMNSNSKVRWIWNSDLCLFLVDGHEAWFFYLFIYFLIFIYFILFFLTDPRDQRPRRRRRNRNRPYGNGSAASGTETDNSVSNYRPSGGRPSQFQNDVSSNLVNSVKTEQIKVKTEPSGPSKGDKSNNTGNAKSIGEPRKAASGPPRDQRRPAQKYSTAPARNGTSGSESDSKATRNKSSASSKPKEQIVNGE
jgi:hypothetical protein